MRNTVLFFTFLFIYGGALFAQIGERQKTMSQGSKNALTLRVPDADQKLVGKVWKDFAKDEFKGKAKFDRRSKEWLIEEADIVRIGAGDRMNVYASTDQRGNDVEFALWIDMGGSYLASKAQPRQFEAAEELMMRFGLAIEREKTRLHLEEEKKQLKQLEVELRRLANKNERYHKEIERAKAAIKKAEENIVDNLKSQENIQETIEEQKEVVEVVRRKYSSI